MALPRTVLFAFMLYAAHRAPDFATSARAFQRRSMQKDLEERIHSLALAGMGKGNPDSSQTHGYLRDTKKEIDTTNSADLSSTHNIEVRPYQESLNSLSEEKSYERSRETAAPGGRNLSTGNDEFYQIDLGPIEDNSDTNHHVHSRASPFALPSGNVFPMVNLSLSNNEPVASQNDGLYLGPTFPYQRKDSHTTIVGESSTPWSRTGAGASHLGSPSPLSPSGTVAATRAGDTTLMFYDDLLKSIHSERVIQAALLSQPPLPNDGAFQPTDDSQPASHRFWTTENEPNGNSLRRGDYRHPIHPLDSIMSRTGLPNLNCIPQHNTLAQQDSNMTISDMYIHPLDITESKDASTGDKDLSRPGHQNDFTPSFSYIKRTASQCGSVHSQETIENWRNNIPPSSPAVPTSEDASEGKRGKLFTTEDPIVPALMIMHHGKSGGVTPGGPILESNRSLPRDKNTRHGDIPIVLSTGLHKQSTQPVHPSEGDYYLRLDELDLPRPAYAYGETRTQRQGSVISSIGYDYSTVASSPSLADSLSNPMYHQQSTGIANASMNQRAFPPRKGSLPISIQGANADEYLKSVRMSGQVPLAASA
ncbi:hypothetical protein BGW38_008071, partial [Lunasporangiospora selenospora]